MPSLSFKILHKLNIFSAAPSFIQYASTNPLAKLTGLNVEAMIKCGPRACPLSNLVCWMANVQRRKSCLKLVVAKIRKKVCSVPALLLELLLSFLFSFSICSLFEKKEEEATTMVKRKVGENSALCKSVQTERLWGKSEWN